MEDIHISCSLLVFVKQKCIAISYMIGHQRGSVSKKSDHLLQNIYLTESEGEFNLNFCDYRIMQITDSVKAFYFTRSDLEQ